MSTRYTNASIAPPKATPAQGEPCQGEFDQPLNEGLGVFRAFVLILIFYFVVGGILWYGWHAWRHWRVH